MLPTADSMTWAGVIADPGGSVHHAHPHGTHDATLLYCHDGAILCHLANVEFTGIAQLIVAEDLALIQDSRVTDISNGGLTIRAPAGDLTVRDSYVMTSTGDLIVQQGGTLLVEYSEIGDTQGSYDHCNFHISSAGSLTITKTNIVNGVVGMMIGGTTGASITGNNWMSNDDDVQEVGVNTAVDMTGNYWENGAPVLGPEYDVSNPALEPIADAGPRL
jgi:nitrous oxidase accessory protein NosD